MRVIVLLMLLVLLAPQALAACITPQDGQAFSDSVVFCKDSYLLPKGIKISADKTVLNCQGSMLQGTGFAAGITAKNVKNSVISGCIVKNYVTGIAVEDADISIIGTEVSNNNLGLKLTNATVKENNNLFANNRQDRLVIERQKIPPRGNFTKVPLGSEVDEFKGPQKKAGLIENIVTDDLLRLLEIPRARAYRIFDSVALEKTRVLANGTVVYTVFITAIEELVNARLYEFLPKEVSVNEVSSKPSFTVLKGNIIEINLGNLKSGDSKTIVLTLNRTVLENPVSVVDAEKSINPGRSKTIRMLFYISIALLALSIFWPRKALRQKFNDGINFVNREMIHGTSLKAVKRKLVDAGWTDGDAEMALQQANEEKRELWIKKYLFEAAAVSYFILFILLNLQFRIVTDQIYILLLLIVVDAGILLYAVKLFAKWFSVETPL